MLQPNEMRTGKTAADLDYWHHMTCRQFSTTECDIHKKADFTGTVKAWTFGTLNVGDVTTRTQDRHLPLVRSASDIRSDPRDHIMLFKVLQGKIGVHQADRMAVASPGDMVVYDQTKPFTVDFMGVSRAFVVAVPRSQAISRLDDAAPLMARRICGKSYAGHFAQSLMSQLQHSGEDMPAGFVAKMESSTLDLIFGSIEECLRPAGGGQKDRKAQQLRKIKDYMLGNLQDSDLTIDLVCLSQGISPSSLNRLFGSEGTTPMRWLWKMRLQTARDTILKGSGLSITDIAFDFGFTDVSHFSRAFKAEFGQSPSSLLRRI